MERAGEYTARHREGFPKHCRRLGTMQGLTTLNTAGRQAEASSKRSPFRAPEISGFSVTAEGTPVVERTGQHDIQDGMNSPT